MIGQTGFDYQLDQNEIGVFQDGFGEDENGWFLFTGCFYGLTTGLIQKSIGFWENKILKSTLDFPKVQDSAGVESFPAGYTLFPTVLPGVPAEQIATPEWDLLF